jgi:BON domain
MKIWICSCGGFAGVDKESTIDSVSLIPGGLKMRNRRWIAVTLGACAIFAFSPMTLWAQSSTPGTTGGGSLSSAGASSTGGSTTGGSTGGGSTGGGTATAAGTNTTSGFATAAPTQAISATGGVTATSMPSSSNSFATTYVTPQSLGLPTLYANVFGQLPKVTGTFGKGLYLSNANNTSSATPSTTTNAGTGFNTAPTPRSPSYVTVLSEDMPRLKYAPSELSAELNAMIARSNYVKNRDAIQVQVAQGNIVVLRGQASSVQERIRVEGMMRMTRGVEGVVNELQVPVVAKN